MVEASSNWTFLTDIARATPCVCGASKGSAFSAEVVVSAAVLVDFGGDIRASGGFRASRGGGGGRLLSPRGVGIVLRPREAVLRPREAVAFIGVISSDAVRRGGVKPEGAAAQRVGSPGRSGPAAASVGGRRAPILLANGLKPNV